MNSKTILASVLPGLLISALIPTNADAADLRVKCEVRSTRSKISVDGFNLPSGWYKCRAISGANVKTTTRKKPTFGELECDFDSNPDDIAAGATAIASNFIKNSRVTGRILRRNAAGLYKTYLLASAICRTR
jgi:hypothetical protein